MPKDLPIGDDGKPVITDDKLEQIITGRSRRKTQGTLFLVAAFLIVALFGLGVVLANAIGKIKTANLNGGSQLLKPKLNPKSLKGEGDGRINITLLGIGGGKHPGGQLTDTIIVASVDPKNKEAAFLSIPRDLYITYPKPLKGAGKINNVHAYGEQQKVTGGGPTLTKKAIAELFDLPIHYFIRVDFEGFRQLVDALGGITINVEKDFYDPLFPDEKLIGYEPFSIKAGLQKLDGKTALKYARSRETTSDFDRAKRQQQIMIAIKEKSLSSNVILNPAKIVELTNIVGNHVKTDLNIQELQRLYELTRDIPKDKIITKVLDTGAGGPLVAQSGEQGYFIILRDPSGQELKRIAHDIFKDPFISGEAATIEISNATSSLGLGGKLAEELVGLGYKIIKVDKAEQLVNQTQIIDRTNGKKPVTLSYLTRRLKASQTKLTVDSLADFVIIVGQDYLTNVAN